MANDIESFRSTVERMDDGVQLAAGQYWRTRHAVSEREDTYVGDSSNPWHSNHRQTDQAGVLAFTARRALPDNMVLLVKSLRIVDGEVHTVVLSPHPDDEDRSDIRFLLEEFYEHLAYAPDGEQVRQRELAVVNDKVRQIQADLIAGPPELAGLPVPQVIVPSMSDLVKVVAHQDRINATAENQLVLAQKKQEWIATHSGQISVELARMSRFLQEQGAAALASVETTIVQVKSIQKGLRTLGLYTGEDVEVETVMEGAPAPADEPLTVYQQRLFMDEELLVAMSTGGVDSEDFHNLADYIKRDPEFVNRVAPSPRSVVLMNLRRHARLPEIVNISQIFEVMTKAREDVQAFLLIRNGENVHLVWSDLIWNFERKSDDFDRLGLKRLFPTFGDANQPFRGVNGRSITPASLDYTDARASFDDRSLAYKRMLLMLWGLHDRTGIFGDFYDRALYDDWTSAQFQEEHFRFIADEEFGLPENRLSVDRMLREKNSYLQAGSRVLVNWATLVDRRSAPSLFRFNNFTKEHEPKFKPELRKSLVTTKLKNGEIIVSGRMRSLHDRSNKLVHIALAGGQAASSQYSWLCIDALSVKELDTYINSRRDRESYSWYMDDFLEARKILLAEELAQAGAIAELTAALEASQLCALDRIRPTVLEGVRLWRAQNGAKLLKSRLFDRKAHLAIMTLMYIVLGKDLDAGELADAVSAALGREPLRVAVDGDAQIVLYATCTQDEQRGQLGRHYWVARMIIDRSLPFPHVKAQEIVALKSRIASEITIKSYPGSGSWEDLVVPENMTYQELGALLESIDHSFPKIVAMADGDADYSVFQRARAMMTEVKRKGVVTRVDFHAPIGLLNHNGVKLLVAKEDPYFVFARGSDEAKSVVSTWIQNNYANPESHLLELDARTSSTSTFNIAWISVADWRAWFANDQDSARHCARVLWGPKMHGDWRTAVRRTLDYNGGETDSSAWWASKLLYCPPQTIELLDARCTGSSGE